MREVVTTIFILLVVLATINLTSITVGYYTIKADIDDIHDEVIKTSLSKSLQPIYKTFFKGLIYHSNEEHFSDRGHYNQYVVYLNTIGLRIDDNELDLYHRHQEVDWDFENFVVSKKERELEVEQVEE